MTNSAAATREGVVFFDLALAFAASWPCPVTGHA